MTKTTPGGRLPGDLTLDKLIERIIRVDHSGEYGAVRIYEGQLFVLGRTGSGPVIAEMIEKEREHLVSFERLLPERRVRPSLLHLVWYVSGFAVGAATALMGPKAAMACTESVENVINDHYARQAHLLGDDEPDLRSLCDRYRLDELAHRDTALAHGAKSAPGYRLLSRAIKAGSRTAIWLAERV